MSGCRHRQDLTFQYPCSFRFPLPAGGTEPVRGSPREAGGTCRRGAIVNSAHAIGMRPPHPRY